MGSFPRGCLSERCLRVSSAAAPFTASHSGHPLFSRGRVIRGVFLWLLFFARAKKVTRPSRAKQKYQIKRTIKKKNKNENENENKNKNKNSTSWYLGQNRQCIRFRGIFLFTFIKPAQYIVVASNIFDIPYRLPASCVAMFGFFVPLALSQ